jgi:hypothetical protein
LSTAALVPAAFFLFAGWVYASPRSFGLIAAFPLFTNAVSLFWLARLLAVRRQRVVLHLRRFGHTDRIVIRALSYIVGRRLRFMTLDDGTLPPVPTPWSDIAAAVLRIPLMAVTLALGTLFVWFLRQNSEGGQDEVLSFGFPVAAVALLAAALIALVRVLLARRRRWLRVADEKDVLRVMKAAAALAGRRWPVRHLVPRLMVVSTSDSCWRPTVLDTSAQSDVLLVDVSSWSTNLLWELENVAASRSEVVYIAAVGSRTSEASNVGDDVERTIKSHLAGKTILLYNARSWKDAWRLGRSLTHAIENAIAASRRRIPVPLRHRVPSFVGVILLIAVLAWSLMLMMDM